MFNLKEIIKKLKLILSSELGDNRITNKDVANALKINYNTFKQQIHKNKIAYEEIMLFCASRKISINWLFFDQAPEILTQPTENIILLRYNSALGSLGNGIENYETEFLNIAIDKIILNLINANYKYTEIIQTYGNSMEPLIKDGSIVFIDKSKTTINPNKFYCIIKENELFIKTIIEQSNKYIARSINKNYADIEFKSTLILTAKNYHFVWRFTACFGSLNSYNLIT